MQTSSRSVSYMKRVPIAKYKEKEIVYIFMQGVNYILSTIDLAVINESQELRKIQD